LGELVAAGPGAYLGERGSALLLGAQQLRQVGGGGSVGRACLAWPGTVCRRACGSSPVPAPLRPHPSAAPPGAAGAADAAAACAGRPGRSCGQGAVAPMPPAGPRDAGHGPGGLAHAGC